MTNGSAPRFSLVEGAVNGKKPRHWGDKAPQEQWTRTLPSTQLPVEMYEALQELAASPVHEFGGKIAPIIREAIEDFIDRYGNPTTPVMTMYQQMKAFRDYWVEERLAVNLLENLSVIETSFDRWRSAENLEQVIALFNKLLNSMKVLPNDWRIFALDKLRDSRSVREAMNFVFDVADLEQRREMEIVHDMIMAGEG